jgi:Cation transport ATPase
VEPQGEAAGLSRAEVEILRRRYGPNQPVTHRRRPLWLQFLARVLNPLVLILLFASGLSAATGNLTNFVIVIVMVVLSVILDFVQEMSAENAVEALRRTVAMRVQVRRDGVEVSEPVDQLVPGDVVRLAAGNLVPADCRLLADLLRLASPLQRRLRRYGRAEHGDDRQPHRSGLKTRRVNARSSANSRCAISGCRDGKSRCRSQRWFPSLCSVPRGGKASRRCGEWSPGDRHGAR